jgi:tetratricopeptide (TPR) repeat protein
VINSAHPNLPAPGTHLGAWEIVHQLGRGGMAVVFEVRDAAGRTGALKLVSGRGGDRAEIEARFRRELRALSRIDHPNVVGTLDHGRWEGRDWFVMDLVRGRDLRAEVEAWEQSPPEDRWARVRRITEDVARALAAVHAAGLVHRDLTPGNVMVREDGHAVLMDFGVAKEAAAPQAEDEELTAHGELLGTVAWMAPEQIMAEAIDARADLYSLGALVYLMLTGRRPFHARTLAGYLDKHLHRPARSPRELAPGVPADLDELCLRLLQKEPELRYSSANHVLVWLAAAPRLQANLQRWPEEPVGRIPERATIAAAVAAVADGQGGVLVISGPAGVGKSMLSGLAATRANDAGLPTHVLFGNHEGGALTAFRPLVEALLVDHPAPPDVLRSLLGAFGDEVVLERFAVFAALRGLLHGTPPRVIVVSDVHLLDDTSLELLEYLVRNTRSLANERILWVLTRTPESSRAGALVSGASTGARPHTVELGPLALQAVEELLGGLLGAGAGVEALARRLHREGEGNPAFIVEMVRGLAEEQVIALEEGAYRLRLDASQVNRHALPIPRSARDAMLARAGATGPVAQEVLRVLALAGQELPFDVLTSVVYEREADLAAGVDELVAAGLARERRVETTMHVDVAQSRLREVIGREIAPAERVRLHRRLGETLERLGRRRLHLVVDALARHFEAGEVPGKAFSYLLRSGTRLLGQSFAREALAAFDRAVALEPEARELVPLDAADLALCELLLRRAEALDAVGEWGRIDADLARAQELAEASGDERLHARARAARGHRARQTGDLIAASEEFHAALALAERAGDQPTRAFAFNQLGSVLWACGDLESARRHWVEGLAVAEGARDDRSIGYGYNGLGMVAACRGLAAESRRNFEQAASVFERVGLVGPLTLVRCNLVEVHVCTGNLRRGMELAERTVAQAREVNQPGGIVLARAAHADALTHIGRPTDGLAEAELALALARELEDPSSVLTALIPAIRAAWATERFETLAPLLDEAVELSALYDHEGWLGIVRAWRARQLAQAGDEAGARESVALALASAGPRWPYQEVRLDLALARVHALLGERAEGARHADAAIKRADACGYRLYVLKGHVLAAGLVADEAAVARHNRVADALGRALAANLAAPDAERFLASEWLRS